LKDSLFAICSAKMSENNQGICRLCGCYRDLSFEHIPPKSAFNDQFIAFETMQNMLDGHSHSVFRKGLGKQSLCVRCNSETGGWYGKSFAEWSKQGLEWFDKLGDKSLLNLPYYIKPLNVIKQILVMALAMSSEKTLNYHQELRYFVLNKEARYLPPKYRVHVYFKKDGEPRFASEMAIMRIDQKSGSYVEAEVSLPPFGYCISTPIKGVASLADSQGLYEITWFSRFAYNEWVPIFLKLPERETHEPLPLDYRSKVAVDEHYRANNIQPRKRTARKHTTPK
jgi:hypothetical protein